MDDQHGNKLQERLENFSAQAILLSETYPSTRAGNHVAAQLLRCGTSPAPQYGEARGAESRSDFIHKLDIALKELNEAGVWLRVSRKARLLPQERIAGPLDECEQLARIINASVQTARRNRGSGGTLDGEDGR